MKFEIEIRQRPPDRSRHFRELLEADVNIETDDGAIVLFENYISILELYDAIRKWVNTDCEGTLEYEPEGYTCNPMLRAIKLDNYYDVTGVNRGLPTHNKIAVREFEEFVNEFSSSVSELQ